MALDPARAALVMQEYRYSIVEDASIRAAYPNATEVVITTNRDLAGGSALAASLYAQTSGTARVYSVTIEDVLYAEDWITAPNRYTLSFDRHPGTGGRVYTLIKSEIDYLAGTTVLTVRG